MKIWIFFAFLVNFEAGVSCVLLVEDHLSPKKRFFCLFIEVKSYYLFKLHKLTKNMRYLHENFTFPFDCDIIHIHLWKKKFLFDFATSIIFHEIIIRTEMKIKEFGYYTYSRFLNSLPKMNIKSAILYKFAPCKLRFCSTSI